MKTIYIDFETYYSTKEKYDLRNISIVEYIHDKRFFIQGCGVKVDSQPVEWYSGVPLLSFIQQFDWENSRVVAHNVKFDGAILAWHFGIRPSQWVDTKAMVKAMIGNSIPSASLKDAAEYLGLPAKGELKTNNIRNLTQQQEEELAMYCKRDVDLCHDIFNALVKIVPGKQWQLIDWTVRAFLEPQLKIDKDVCQSVHDKIVEKKQGILDKLGVDRKVLSSNQQFAKLLEEKGYPVPMKLNKKGKQIPALSVQDEDFLKMRSSSDKKLKELCEARVAVKQTLEETRAKKMATIAGISDYCFDIIFSGAQQTHRFSGGNGCAGNPQNFRRNSELRGAITA